MTEEISVDIKKDPYVMIVSLIKTLKEFENIDTYIFGGWVRDMISNEPYVDIDIFISNHKVVERIIELLRITGRIKNIRRGQRYFNEKYNITSFDFIELINKTKIDIVSPPLMLNRNPDICDFTCNNLIMRSNGTIGTRCGPLHYTQYNEIQWTSKCIKDTMDKKLVWMIYPGIFNGLSIEEKIEFNWRLEKRLKKMQEKGYKYNKESISNFRLWRIHSHKDVFEGRSISENCAICSDKYEETTKMKTIILMCGHDFHYDCIKKWKVGQENETCPTCRENIIYSIDK